MSIDVIESRIASLQAGMDAIANGAPPPSSSAASFADLLASQSMDQGDSTATDDASAVLSTDDGSTDPTSLGDLSDLAGLGDTGTGSVTDGTTTTSGLTGQDVVADAKKYLGVPYLWGGTNPAKGLDCSGLVQRVMKDLGVTMPRTVHDQRNVGTEVGSMAQAKPGDLLVFGTHHIGIYLGNGKMLHAPHTGDHVRISDVYETPTRIRRVLPSGASSSLTGTTVGDVRPLSLRQSGSGDASHRFDAVFERATQTYKLPSGLLRAVASVESSFRPNAVSAAGARGLMQLMPGTAKSLKVDPMNPTQAVDGAARLLSGLIHEFGSVKLAVAAYNAGPGAVHQYGGVPPYSETKAYVRKVMSTMEAQ